MKKISKEQEYHLIREFINLEFQIQDKIGEIKYCKTTTEKSYIKQFVKDLKAKLTIASNELKDIENPQASKEILDHLNSFLYLFKYRISNPKIDLPISRCQGKCFNDFYIAKILAEVRFVINGDFKDLRKPFFLSLTSDQADGLDNFKLKSFLEQEISNLQAILPLNYVALKYFHKGFAKRLTSLTDN